MGRPRKVPEEDPGERKTYTVAYPPGLNLRAEPSKKSRILRILKAGETVAALDDVEAPEGWLSVDGGGYVMREFLE